MFWGVPYQLLSFWQWQRLSLMTVITYSSLKPSTELGLIIKMDLQSVTFKLWFPGNGSACFIQLFTDLPVCLFGYDLLLWTILSGYTISFHKLMLVFVLIRYGHIWDMNTKTSIRPVFILTKVPIRASLVASLMLTWSGEDNWRNLRQRTMKDHNPLLGGTLGHPG